MIKLKRLNNSEIILNCDRIVYIEETPDTVITMENGHKIVVTDTADKVIEKVIAYKRKIYHEFSYDK